MAPRLSFLPVLPVVIAFVLTSCGGTTPRSNAQPASVADSTYSVSLFVTPEASAAVGQVSVDTDGKVTVLLTGVTDSTTFSTQFCPYPGQKYSCFAVGSISSDGNGHANTSLQFPHSGTWSGDFQLVAGEVVQYQTNIPSGTNSGVYSAQLVPDDTTNGSGINLVDPPPPQAPLTSGNLTLTNGQIEVKMTGALPNTLYSAGECPLFAGSSCYGLSGTGGDSNFETDGNGNVDFAVMPDGVTGDNFSVQGQGNSYAGYAGGFSVP